VNVRSFFVVVLQLLHWREPCAFLECSSLSVYDLRAHLIIVIFVYRSIRIPSSHWATHHVIIVPQFIAQLINELERSCSNFDFSSFVVWICWDFQVFLYK
jgi:hypothetical protein